MGYRKFCQIVCLGLSAIVAGGCGRSGTIGSGAGAAFDSADAELKARWETAVAADRTNGYVVAYSTLIGLRHPTKVTPDQLRAVSALLDSLTTRLYAAAQKGDSEAQAAAREIAKMGKGGPVK